MKKTIFIHVVLLLIGSLAFGQTDNIRQEDLQMARQKAMQYYQLLNENKKQLDSLTLKAQAGHILFGWPLRTNGSYDDIPNYYFLHNFVDDDNSFPVKEFNCGNRAYDGHNGTDISLWPFWWNMKDKDYVLVVAAAPGVVVTVIDNNNNDDNCITAGDNNLITIMHADSTLSMYYHIKDNSARVNEGDIVVQGQQIANVASSGSSSNPHLHFEVRDPEFKLIDPWVGTNPAIDCNNRNEETYWQNQKPYWEPQINRVMTHSLQPSVGGYNAGFCRNEEIMNAKNSFAPGDLVWLGVAVHDYLTNTSINYTVFYPDGSQLTQGSHFNGLDTTALSYRTFGILLPNNAPSGTYQVQVTYQGVSYYHYFTVNCVPIYSITGILFGPKGYIASNTINSTATLAAGSNIRMQAAGSIQLNPGFTATAGTTFKARIRDCNFSE